MLLNNHLKRSRSSLLLCELLVQLIFAQAKGFEDCSRLSLALHRHQVNRPEHDEIVDSLFTENCRAAERLCRVLRVEAFQPCGQVNTITKQSVLHSLCRANVARQNIARVDSAAATDLNFAAIAAPDRQA